MKHIDDIAALVRTLQQSGTFHALVIQSPPGWAKSSTIEKVLREQNVPYKSLGSYTTPLGLYNAICDRPNELLVLDDCAGIFGDQRAMSVLKAATWASVGSEGVRRISWISSSDKVGMPDANFSGKFILLTNSLPAGKETEAFLSRTLYLRLAFDKDQVGTMLLEAAQSPLYYENTELALKVANRLISEMKHRDYRKINLRTLQMGYEIAKSNAESWGTLLERLLPEISPAELAEELKDSPRTVEEQAREFTRITGLSRRTFFNHRSASAIAE